MLVLSNCCHTAVAALCLPATKLSLGNQERCFQVLVSFILSIFQINEVVSAESLMWLLNETFQDILDFTDFSVSPH